MQTGAATTHLMPLNATMIKQFLSILFICLFSLTPKAQTPANPERKETRIGEKISSGREIYASSYILPEKIYSFYVEPNSSRILIETRKWKNAISLASRGVLHAYDINAMTGKWQRKVNYNGGGVSYFGNHIMQNNQTHYQVIDPLTGVTKYAFDRELQYVFPDLNLGLGYVFNPDFPFTLEGFQLDSGKTIWRRKIPRNRVWNEIIEENDSIIVISSTGLHAVNLKSGKGWSSDVETSPRYENPYYSPGYQTATVIALGFLSGVFIIPVPFAIYNKKILINESKILLDENSYYVASQHRITALNKDGTEKWVTSLPEKMISKTQFFKIEKNLILFNFNSDELQNEKRRSFIASFDAETGKPNYITFLRNDSPEIFIQDYELIGDYIGLLYPDKIETRDIRNGKTVFEKVLDDMNFQYYIGEDVYVEDDSTMIALINKNPSHKYIYTESGNIVEYNSLYISQREYASDDYYILLSEFPGGRIVQNSNDTYILDENNVKKSRLSFHENFSVVDHHLYFFDKDKFFSIALKNLIGD